MKTYKPTFSALAKNDNDLTFYGVELWVNITVSCSTKAPISLTYSSVLIALGRPVGFWLRVEPIASNFLTHYLTKQSLGANLVRAIRVFIRRKRLTKAHESTFLKRSIVTDFSMTHHTIFNMSVPFTAYYLQTMMISRPIFFLSHPYYISKWETIHQVTVHTLPVKSLRPKSATMFIVTNLALFISNIKIIIIQLNNLI